MHGNGGVNDYMTYFFAMQALLFPSSPASSQDPAVPQITTRPEAVTHGIAIMTLVWFGSRYDLRSRQTFLSDLPGPHDGRQWKNVRAVVWFHLTPPCTPKCDCPPNNADGGEGTARRL
jgi:hypothetical protein